METVACNLCRSGDYRLVYRMPDRQYYPDEFFSVVACRRCGLGFVNPRPTFIEMGRYYPAAFYEGFAEQESGHHRRYEREAAFVEQAVKTEGKRLLDLGCANGDFGRYMQQRGWQVEGLEVSSNTQDVSDFPIFRHEFPRLPICEPTYDAITAWAVIEHVHDPMAHFCKASEVLKPGGVFLFLVTNFESLASRRLFAEDIPRHLYFFTEGTVRQYCARAGLELVSADYSDQIYGMSPTNWLLYLVNHHLRGRSFEWQDYQRIKQYSRPRFFRARGLRPTWINTLRYLGSHPVYVLDRLLMPLYARYQMWTRQYGIVTYVAKKRGSG